MIDADANRAAEGLRVLEDVARFILDRSDLSRTAKDLRHRLRQSIPGSAIAGRDVAADVGRSITAADEDVRNDLVALIRANASRVAEAVRALAEAGKLARATAVVIEAEAVRYALYPLEAALVAALPRWRFSAVRLYAIIDTALTGDPVGVTEAVIRGGAGAVQLRAKNLGERAYLELARRIQEVCTPRALFVVNDHVAVARAIGSDAIHVGQDDLPVPAVREVVGVNCGIGLSIHTPVQLAAEVASGTRADYIGLGPMFATATKPHEPVQGPGLLDAARGCDRPSFAIGGITRERLGLLASALPHGIAVGAALCRARDPEAAARELLALLGDPTPGSAGQTRP